MQRVFDVENEKDMQDLWDILPDNVVRISYINKYVININFKDDVTNSHLFKINWHGKTEIFRPLQEATEADVGKLCVFWEKGQRDAYGVLESVVHTENGGYDYQSTENRLYSHCRRLTKQEIKELI